MLDKKKVIDLQVLEEHHPRCHSSLQNEKKELHSRKETRVKIAKRDAPSFEEQLPVLLVPTGSRQELALQDNSYSPKCKNKWSKSSESGSWWQWFSGYVPWSLEDFKTHCFHFWSHILLYDRLANIHSWRIARYNLTKINYFHLNIYN